MKRFNTFTAWALGFLTTLQIAQAGAALVADDPSSDSILPTILSVDLRDLVEFHDASWPQAKAILNAMESSPSLFFPPGVSFSFVGVGRSTHHRVHKQLKNSVYGVEFEAPITNDPAIGRQEAQIIALMHRERLGFVYRRLSVTVEGAPLRVTDVRVREEFPSSDTHFSIETSLIQRKAILTDSRHGVRKIYPVAVGGFDEGISRSSRGRTRLVTPEFFNATLDRATVIPARSDPAYYANMPFLRITTERREQTAFAFHIVQHAHAARNGPDYNHMVRGFDSHGCMRLREKDLYELHAILMTQDAPQMQLNVRLRVAEFADHPLPLRNHRYVTVANGGTGDQPRIRLDEHGLAVMKETAGTPPINHLIGVQGGSREMRAMLKELRISD